MISPTAIVIGQSSCSDIESDYKINVANGGCTPSMHYGIYPDGLIKAGIPLNDYDPKTLSTSKVIVQFFGYPNWEACDLLVGYLKLRFPNINEVMSYEESMTEEIHGRYSESGEMS